MKQVIFAHHGGKANAKGVVQLPVDPDAARKAMSDLDAMSNAWVKASTDLDINSIHGMLNQLDVPTNAAKVLDTDGVSNIGASFGRLPENRIALYGPEFEDLVKKFDVKGTEAEIMPNYDNGAQAKLMKNYAKYQTRMLYNSLNPVFGEVFEMNL